VEALELAPRTHVDPASAAARGWAEPPALPTTNAGWGIAPRFPKLTMRRCGLLSFA